MAEVIPLVCRHCGKDASVSLCGHVDVTVEVWRGLKTCGWDTNTNSLKIELGPVESEPDPFGIEDEVDDARLEDYVCAWCQHSEQDLNDLIGPKYGVDRWGRILDEDGEPHGPMVVHPDQLKLETKAL